MNCIRAFADFDIIANNSIQKNEITLSELKQILLVNTVEFEKKKVFIIALSPDADNSDSLAKETMGMTAVQAKKHWLTKVFNGAISSSPLTFDSPDEVVEKVSTTQGAIAVVPKGTKPGKAKLLRLK